MEPCSSTVSKASVAIFLNESTIEGTGEYFLPILHYLRTRRLFIPPNVDVEAVQEEARYFLLTDLVDEIDKILETKRAEKGENKPCGRRKNFKI